MGAQFRAQECVDRRSTGDARNGGTCDRPERPVARRLGDWLDATAGGSENRLLILLMAAVGGLGSLMSSTAVVAIFIPVVLRISQNRGMAPSRLMMPLSFAALISGLLTLVATAPYLVVNAELIRQGAQ